VKLIVCTYVIITAQVFAVTNVGGVIATNTVWGPTGNPPDTIYNLIDDIFVLDTVTLTIQPGVRVQASNWHCIQIYGRIIACGTLQDSILFTSNQQTPSTGDWYGIWFFTPGVDSSHLEYCIIEYAQYGIDRGQVFAIENSLLRYCNEGLSQIKGGLIDSNEITNNTAAGITIGMVDNVLPVIGNNAISNNPCGVYVDYGPMPCYIVSNHFSENGIGIEIWGSLFDITEDMTWNPAVGGVDCVLHSGLTIAASGKLTITAGNTFKMHGPLIAVNGQLIACGTADSMITFTSSQPIPNPGDWDGIWFSSSATDSSKIDHCIIEYGRGVTTSSATPMRISHSIVRYNQIDGIFCNGNITVDSCQISDNVAGISYGNSYMLESEAYFGANTITDNDYGIHMGGYPTKLPIFHTPNQFANNTHDIYIEGNVLVQDEYVWNPAVGGVDCEIFGDIIIDSTGIFTINPGNTFKIFFSMLVHGQLIACGTEQSKITYTSPLANPAPGSWGAIRFMSGSRTGIMEHCIVEYSSWGIDCYNDSTIIRHSTIRNSNRGITFVNTSGIIEHCHIDSNGWFGILVTSPRSAEEYLYQKSIAGNGEKTLSRTGTVIIKNSIISNNERGIWCYFGGNPQLEFNEIYGNTEWGIYNEDNDYWIYAENNWWGDSTGPRDTSDIDTLYNPNGLGDRVSDHVDYDPWIGFVGCAEKPVVVPLISNVFNVPYPNPFVHTTTLSYELARDQHVKCVVYNALGRAVRTLCDQPYAAGSHRLFWNGRDNPGRVLPAGVYWCCFEADSVNNIQKIIKLE